MSEQQVVVRRPFGTLGIGWILALIVVIIAALGLLDVIPINGKLVQVEIILLALALLL